MRERKKEDRGDRCHPRDRKGRICDPRLLGFHSSEANGVTAAPPPFSPDVAVGRTFLHLPRCFSAFPRLLLTFSPLPLPAPQCLDSKLIRLLNGRVRIPYNSESDRGGGGAEQASEREQLGSRLLFGEIFARARAFSMGEEKTLVFGLFNFRAMVVNRRPFSVKCPSSLLSCPPGLSTVPPFSSWRGWP